MTNDQRADLIRAFTEAWNAKDLDSVMALMAEECVFRASVGPEPGVTYSGRDAVREAFAGFLAPTAGPDPEALNAPVLVGESFAVTRWTLRWPEGGPAEVRGCDVFEFAGDRIGMKDTYRKVPLPSPT